MTFYIGVSDAHYQSRSSYPPRHLTERGTEPARGARGTMLCGIWGSIWQETEDAYLAKHGRDHICKKCLRVYDRLQSQRAQRTEPPPPDYSQLSARLAAGDPEAWQGQ